MSSKTNKAMKRIKKYEQKEILKGITDTEEIYNIESVINDINNGYRVGADDLNMRFYKVAIFAILSYYTIKAGTIIRLSKEVREIWDKLNFEVGDEKYIYRSLAIFSHDDRNLTYTHGYKIYAEFNTGLEHVSSERRPPEW